MFSGLLQLLAMTETLWVERPKLSTVSPTPKNASSLIDSSSFIMRSLTVVLLLASSIKKAEATLQDGLVAYYPFNGNANDVSGNENNGVVHSAALTTDRLGLANRAYSFNGASSYIEIANGAAFNFVNDLSFSLWVYPSVSQNAYAYILDQSHNSNSGLIMGQDAGNTNNFVFAYFDAQGAYRQTIPVQFASNSWNHYAVTKKNKMIKYYLNNILFSTVNVTTASIAQVHGLPFTIGAYNSGGTQPASGVLQFFSGRLDDISIYNRALSSSEVTRLYNFDSPTSQPSRQPSSQPSSQPLAQPTIQPTQQPTSHPSSQPSRQPSKQPTSQPSSQPSFQPTLFLSDTLKNGLVAFYPFEGNANDKSGNSNNGVAHSATLTTDRFGFSNRAYSFDGASSYIKIEDGTQFDFTNSFSISFWAKPSSSQLFQAVIISKSHLDNGRSEWAIHQIDTALNNYYLAYRQQQIDNWFWTNGIQFLTNQWNHLVITKQNSVVTTFLNGIPVFATNNSYAIIKKNGNLPFFIGANGYDNGLSINRFFNGTLDDIFIYNRSLSISEVGQLYNFDSPTSQPSRQPSSQPSKQPIALPTAQPSSQPSMQPSAQPSRMPTKRPTSQPTRQPTVRPSRQPTSNPTTRPSRQPTSNPTSKPTRQPTVQPSVWPSVQPSAQPSSEPSAQPSSRPSVKPSQQPTGQPSWQPSVQPSAQPSGEPSAQPSFQPSARPSTQPSGLPSAKPSRQPTSRPSSRPSHQPSVRPSRQPSSRPSGQPSSSPSLQPFAWPTMQPSSQPSVQPMRMPTKRPTGQPSRQPTVRPSWQPTSNPTGKPSRQPISRPSSRPSRRPSGQPSVLPSLQPFSWPTTQPSSSPSGQPSRIPSVQPIAWPSVQPSTHPSSQPSRQPFAAPTSQPTVFPTARPSSFPTFGLIPLSAANYTRLFGLNDSVSTIFGIGENMLACGGTLNGFCFMLSGNVGGLIASYGLTIGPISTMAFSPRGGVFLLSQFNGFSRVTWFDYTNGVIKSSVLSMKNRYSAMSVLPLNNQVAALRGQLVLASSSVSDYPIITFLDSTTSQLLVECTLGVKSKIILFMAFADSGLMITMGYTHNGQLMYQLFAIREQYVVQSLFYSAGFNGHPVNTVTTALMYNSPTGKILTLFAGTTIVTTTAISNAFFYITNDAWGYELSGSENSVVDDVKVIDDAAFLVGRLGTQRAFIVKINFTSKKIIEVMLVNAPQAISATWLVLMNETLGFAYDDSKHFLVSILNQKTLLPSVQHSDSGLGWLGSDATIFKAARYTLTAATASRDSSCTQPTADWLMVNDATVSSYAITPISMKNMPSLRPTKAPVSQAPTLTPSLSKPSSTPSGRPSRRPTGKPSVFVMPTSAPSSRPTITFYPTTLFKPTLKPTVIKTSRPTKWPTVRPTGLPTRIPSPSPSFFPSKAPSERPSTLPTESPSLPPTKRPSNRPQSAPTPAPSRRPSVAPSPKVTLSPTAEPTFNLAIASAKDDSNNKLIFTLIGLGSVIGIVLISGIVAVRLIERQERKLKEDSDKPPLKIEDKIENMTELSRLERGEMGVGEELLVVDIPDDFGAQEESKEVDDSDVESVQSGLSL